MTDTLLDHYDISDARRLLIEIDAQECEEDFAVFIERAWNIIDPAPFMSSWVINALADHLMAVADGTIRKLLINLPPRMAKSRVCSEFFPAWVWANKQRANKPLLGPQVRFLCMSYASTLAMDNARNHKRLIEHPWYRERWGSRVRIDPKQDLQDAFATTAHGVRYSLGFGGSVLGRGGDIKIIDDPHKPDEVESELVRGAVIRQYDEELAFRANNFMTNAEIIVMQRLAEDDLSGHILESGGSDLVHLMLPMQADPDRRCVTVLGWSDPRLSDEDGDELPARTRGGLIIPGSALAEANGALLWPERFPQQEVDKLIARAGPYGAAGRLNQSPIPRGGGIFKAEWWRLWRNSDYPSFSTVLVSLDTASTEKEENDESALTAWGAFADENGRPQIMLIDAWEGFLEFDPLLQRVAEMCRAPNGNPSCKADILLVENKNISHPVMSELRRAYGNKEWTTIPFDPKGDKVARALAIQHLFSGHQVTDAATGMKTWTGGNIWAPDTDWAQLVIDRNANFPKGKRKGITDTTSQALKYLRDGGVILRTEEYDDEITEERTYRKAPRPRYDV